MPITLNCPKCHKPFRVRDESVGGKVRCPMCAAVLQVPASLAPVSHLGFDAPPQDVDPAEMSNIHRPLADDVAAQPASSLDDLLMGGAGRRTSGGGFSPGETALPAPPSIKMRGPSPVAPQPKKPEIVPPANVFQAPPAPAPAPAPKPAPKHGPRPASMLQQELRPVSSSDDPTAGWRKVRGGLKLIRWGLYLWLVPIACAIGHAAWAVKDSEAALKVAPTILKLEGVPAWQEWIAAYTALPIGLGVLLLLWGRLKCAKVPAEANARGLIRVAAFCTVVAALTGAIGIAASLPALAGKLNLPSQVGPTALAIYFPTAIMADICTLLFIGQIGWPLSQPQLQRKVAGFFAFALFAPAAIVIANQFYPMVNPVLENLRANGNPFAGGEDDDLTKRSLLLAVLGVTMVILLFLRYAGVAGAARRAIRNQLGE